MEKAESSLETYLRPESGKNYLKKWENAVSVMVQLIKGMAFLKIENVAHRDIKADNILMMADNTPKIGDTGLAREQKHEETSITKLVGTEAYMAPEVAKGFNNQHDKLDWFKCDTYSMGIVFLRLCGAGKFDIVGLNGSASESQLTASDIKNKLENCLQKVKDAYQGVNLEKFIELLKLMLTNDPLGRPDMLDIYGACVKGKKLDFKNLEKLTNVLSDKPDAQTMFDMAMLFCDNVDRQNTLKTDQRIVKWFTKAEVAGNLDAQFMLGFINQYALCTEEKDRGKLKLVAKEYYTKAMTKGDDEAREALEKFELPDELYEVTLEEQTKGAIEGKNVDDQFMMGWRYHYGLGVAQNNLEAKKYYEMAVAQKDEDAEEELNKLNELIAGN